MPSDNAKDPAVDASMPNQRLFYMLLRYFDAPPEKHGLAVSAMIETAFGPTTDLLRRARKIISTFQDEGCRYDRREISAWIQAHAALRGPADGEGATR